MLRASRSHEARKCTDMQLWACPKRASGPVLERMRAFFGAQSRRWNGCVGAFVHGGERLAGAPPAVRHGDPMTTYTPQPPISIFEGWEGLGALLARVDL